MDTGRITVCVVTVALLAVSPVAAAATATGPSGVAAVSAQPATGVPAVTPDRLATTQSVDPDTVLLRADVDADGTATWRIEYLVRLDDQNTTDAFESVAADIRDDPTQFTDRFTDRMRRTVAAAENATGREMAVENVSVAAERQDLGAEYGVVRYEFTWTNFAAANETSLRIGDALGGFFLDSETQLTVAWPSAYNLVSVSPSAADQSPTEVVWEGRQSFSSTGPQVVVSTAGPTTTQQGGPGGGGDGGSSTDGTMLLLVAVVAALVALAVTWVVIQRRGDDGQPTGGADAASTGATDAGSAAAATGSDPDGGDSDDDAPPEELLSNEERVLKLLDERGGRIKQQEIAGELDWTDAKTSQVVTGLREDDAVEVFRLGRENVVSLPDEDDI